MPIPASGPLSMSMFNTEVSRASNFENSILAGSAVPTTDSLVYIAGQIGPLDQNAPHSFSEWYGFAPTTTTTTTTTTTSTTTSTTTAPPTTTTSTTTTTTTGVGTTTTTSTTTTTTTAPPTTTTSTTTTTTTVCPCVCGVTIRNDAVGENQYTYQDCYNNVYSGSLKENETFLSVCPDPSAGTIKNNSVTTTSAATVTYGSCDSKQATTTSTTTTTTSASPNCTFTGGSAVQACSFTISQVQTTDPTNQQGNNGTATITFINGAAPVTYTLNGVNRGTATSPLTINNLLANTSYTVVLTDVNGCTTQATFQVGDTVFTFEANYLMLTYEFTNGTDLDTRTRIVTPNVGQVTPSDYVGWNVKSQWPQPSATPFEIWGDDNEGNGYESVLINLDNFKAAYPSATSIVVDLRAFWFRVVGTNPVNVAATLWKGGTPIKNGCYRPIPNEYYCWTNPTATSTFDIDSVGTVITSTNRTSGQRVATLTYNLITGAGLFNNNDTTTPSV